VRLFTQSIAKGTKFVHGIATYSQSLSIDASSCMSFALFTQYEGVTLVHGCRKWKWWYGECKKSPSMKALDGGKEESGDRGENLPILERVPLSSPNSEPPWRNFSLVWLRNEFSLPESDSSLPTATRNTRHLCAAERICDAVDDEQGSGCQAQRWFALQAMAD
jgi:hypothetical protein